MNYLDYHNLIIDELVFLGLIQADNIKQPKDAQNIISNIVKETSVDSSILVDILIKITNIEHSIKLDQKIEVDSSGDGSLIINKVLYLVNPFDEEIKQNKLNLKQKGVIDFNGIGIIAYDHPKIPQIASNLSKVEEGKHHKIGVIWAGLLAEIKKLEPIDIHFQPEEEHVKVRFKITHGLTRYKDLSNQDYKKFANFLLMSAGINSASFALPQRGKIVANGIEFRFESLPTNHLFKSGELIPKITLRAHYQHHNVLSLKAIGLIKQQENILRNIIKSINQGSIIISGKVGAGKTTTLYALLHEILKVNQGEFIIHTLEDPVEINIPGINQTSINKKANIDYANTIPSLLRSGIDLALLGEINNEETARNALKIPLTGHIAFSTIHAANALGVIARLEEFGIHRQLMSLTLDVLIEQRLVRRVCQQCSSIAHFNINNELSYKYEKFKLAGKNNIRFANKDGCKNCLNGYSGVIPILEIIQLDFQAKKMISSGEDVITIKNYLYGSTQDIFLNKSLMQAAVNALFLGLTTTEELGKIPDGEFEIPNDLNCK